MSVVISLVTWDLTSDAVILIMPLPMIWSLHLKTKEKILLTGECRDTDNDCHNTADYDSTIKASSSSVQCELFFANVVMGLERCPRLISNSVIVCSLLSCSAVATGLQGADEDYACMYSFR